MTNQNAVRQSFVIGRHVACSDKVQPYEIAGLPYTLRDKWRHGSERRFSGQQTTKVYDCHSAWLIVHVYMLLSSSLVTITHFIAQTETRTAFYDRPPLAIQILTKQTTVLIIGDFRQSNVVLVIKLIRFMKYAEDSLMEFTQRSYRLHIIS
jgi:hypothetical protein